MSDASENKTRLLLVDDHALFREGLARLLASEPDFDLAPPCSTGEEALKALESREIDLILLDYDLGTETGSRFLVLAGRLNTPVGELETRLEALLEHDRAQERQLEQAMRRLARADFEMLLGGVMEAKGARVLAAQVDVGDPDRLREMADWFRDRVKSGVAVLGTVKDGKPLIVAAVTEDLIGRGLKAGDIVREVAKVVGGGGGGRADMAQAGGRNPDKLAEALDTVRTLVEASLKE